MAEKRDDDITDLTGDGGAEGKRKANANNKKKKDIVPEQPAPHQADAARPEEKGKFKVGKKGKAKGAKTAIANHEKKGGKLKLKLILIIVPILLVAGFVAVLATNLFGVRDIVGKSVKEPILKVVVWFDPEFRSVDNELKEKSKEREEKTDKRETGLDKREAEISGRETELDIREELLDKRESQLTRRSAALDNREEQINQASQKPDNAAPPLYHRAMSEQELEDIQSLSRYYAKMSPETAAAILVELKDEQHVATILYYTSERNAAAILAVMEPGFAARITEILLS